VAIFFVGERYRLPLFVPLCVTAAAALDRLLQAFRKPTSVLHLPISVLRPPTSVGKMAAVGLAACVVTFWPFRLEDGRFDERLRLSKVLMNRGDYGLAAMELERAHALDPSHTIAEFNLGMALISSGRAAEGIAHVRRAVDAGVAMPGARYALAGALMATGDRDGAAKVLRTSAPAAEDSAESCYRVALLALDAGAPDVAERYVRHALAIRPGWSEAEALLAQIRSGRG
jgi:Flp pilus assembly protein TadD